MDRETLSARFGRIRTWQSGGQRAPHKPLLLLLALGNVCRRRPRLNRYGGEIEPALLNLLARFGPPRRAHHPEQPYSRLRSDGLWEIPGFDELPFTRGDIPAVEALRGSSGGFPEPVFELLSSDPALLAELASSLLEGHFPPSMHADICESVGIPTSLNLASLTQAMPAIPPRDPAFRHRVLRAYNQRCAVCGYDVRIGDRLLGLDASHIKWHAYGGPDIVPNGLALCLLHHKALDAGAMGLERSGGRDVRILVSREVSGGDAGLNQLIGFGGGLLRPPQQEDLAPAAEFIDWHRSEVFREPSWRNAQ